MRLHLSLDVLMLISIIKFIMYLCVCKAVSHRAARELVALGVDSAEELACRTGAGTACGACQEDVERLVGRVREDRELARELPLAAK